MKDGGRFEKKKMAVGMKEEAVGLKREDGGRFEKRVLLPTVSRKEK